MKKIVPTILVLAFTFFSCLKENHKIRFKNENAVPINNVVIGTANIGDVGILETSDYFKISSGSFSISGTTAIGQKLSGSGTISGKGLHEWTVTLSSSVQLTLSRDL